MKTAIITGASGNLGTSVVRKFINEGYYVIGTVSSGNSLVNFPKDQFERIVVNLNDQALAKQVAKDIITKRKKIDAAILTVGGFNMGKIAETNTQDIFKQYQLNFETTYNIAQPVFKHMMEQKEGRIFMIGSRAGLDARHAEGTVAYSLSKSLVFRLSELMNEEAKGTNVITTIIVPSIIDTPQNRKSMPDADFETWVKPETIADTIYWYCSGEALAIKEPVIKIYNKA
ncbi:MAG TPA: SDR family NAD(P)-dependent oxidoreductase [Chitinophagaceae bacterium]|nr:SDR family NAD(P)-dependent oxidoreductase [Chitinophagaceae bacterium]